MTKRICLWSGPRNISTTLMYSFAQRSDTKVFDEPLYAHYLKRSKAKNFHPAAIEILESQENNGELVIQSMLTNKSAPVLFFKQMTHHLKGLNLDFLKQTENIILTRNPLEMLPSFHKIIKNPKMEDVGYEDHLWLLEFLRKHQIAFTVLDATKVLLNPEEQLKKLCIRLQIPFQPQMLSWPKGKRKEDGVWANYWYKSVHNSIGFKAYTPKEESIPKEIEPLVDKCLPIYEKLKSFAI